MPGRHRVVPSTAEEASEEGMDFGFAHMDLSRAEFEQELAKRLLTLEELLTGNETVAEIIAGFDRSAWDAWEVGHG